MKTLRTSTICTFYFRSQSKFRSQYSFFLIDVEMTNSLTVKVKSKKWALSPKNRGKMGRTQSQKWPKIGWNRFQKIGAICWYSVEIISPQNCKVVTPPRDNIISKLLFCLCFAKWERENMIVRRKHLVISDLIKYWTQTKVN